MNLKILLTVFTTVFLAELGDKTQIATLLFSADKQISKLGVFVAAAAALVLSTAIAVVVGGTVSHLLNRRVLSISAGVGFIVIGVWTVVQGLDQNASIKQLESTTTQSTLSSKGVPLDER